MINLGIIGLNFLQMLQKIKIINLRDYLVKMLQKCKICHLRDY